MRLIYLGSPSDAIFPLQFLLEQSKHDVIAVITQPAKKKGRSKQLSSPPLAEFAKQQGIPLFQPEKVSANSFLSKLKGLKPDICITCAYGQLLSDQFLEIPKRATINIHPSLLPKYRGAIPVPAALLNGEKETGISILFTVKALDAGNLILQKTIPIQANETAPKLLSRLFKDAGPLLEEALTTLENPNFIGTPQNPSHVTHCKKISKNQGEINWHQVSQVIYNQFRAFYDWPGSYTFLNNKRLIIKALSMNTDNTNKGILTSVGEFTFDKQQQLLIVKTKDHFLQIKTLQPEGKKVITASDYWNSLQHKANVPLKFDTPSLQKVSV